MILALRVDLDGEFDIVILIWLISSADHNWVGGWFSSDPICLIFLLIMALYMILLDGLLGATQGKFLLCLCVVDPDGKRPALGRSIVCNVRRTIESLPTLNVLDMILLLKSEQQVRFGDQAARTRKIDLRSL